MSVCLTSLLLLSQSLRHRGRAEEEAPRGLNSCGLSVRNYMYNPHGINVFNVTPVLMPVPYLPMYTLDLVHD